MYRISSERLAIDACSEGMVLSSLPRFILAEWKGPNVKLLFALAAAITGMGERWGPNLVDKSKHIG
jgi:hypothetical protein